MQSETQSTMIIQIVLLSVYGQATAAAGSESESSKATARCYTVHSEIFFPNLFDFKKSISGPIELKFSGKTLYAIL